MLGKGLGHITIEANAGFCVVNYHSMKTAGGIGGRASWHRQVSQASVY